MILKDSTVAENCCTLKLLCTKLKLMTIVKTVAECTRSHIQIEVFKTWLTIVRRHLTSTAQLILVLPRKLRQKVYFASK